MTDKKWYIVSILLLLALPVGHLLVIVLPSILWMGDLMRLTLLELASLVGFLLLLTHYHRSRGREERKYRAMDRILPMLIFVFPGGYLLLLFLVIHPSPDFWIGVPIGRSVAIAALALLWCCGLWSANPRVALTASFACFLLLSLPESRAVQEVRFRILEENRSVHQETVDISPEIRDSVSQMPVTSTDFPDAIDSEHTILVEPSVFHVPPHWARHLPILLLFAYTWMRWGSRTDMRIPNLLSRYLTNHTVRRHQLVGALFFCLLPVAAGGAVLLSFIAGFVPLISNALSSQFEAALIVIAACVFAFAFLNKGAMDAAHPDHFKRAFVIWLKIAFVLFCLLALHSIYRTIHEVTSMGGAIAFTRSLYWALLATGMGLWVTGVDSGNWLKTAWGVILFAALFSPDLLIWKLYPETLSRQRFPSPDDPVACVFWGKYYHYHICLLMSMTLTHRPGNSLTVSQETCTMQDVDTDVVVDKC